MRTSHILRGFTVLAAVVGLIAPEAIGEKATDKDKPPEAFAPMQDLGTLPDHEASDAFAMNEHGLIVGTSSDEYTVFDPEIGEDVGVSDAYPVYWDASGIHALPLVLDTGEEVLGGLARAVNNSGQIAGVVFGEFGQRAFLYENGVMRKLGILPGGNASVARGMNSLGHAAGSANVTVGFRPDGSPIRRGHAALFRDGAIIDLGTLSGGDLSLAYAVNDLGQVVGQSNKVPNGNFAPFYPVLWQPAGDGTYQAIELANQGGSLVLTPDGPGNVDFARCINNLGQIGGVSGQNDADLNLVSARPYVWEAPYPGSVTQLRGTAATQNGVANGINDRSEMVGFLGVNAGGSTTQGVYWRNGGKNPVLLGSIPGGSTSFARAINRQRAIVGLSDTGIAHPFPEYFNPTQAHAFLIPASR